VLLDVERLTFGPDALAHEGRQVVFVAHGAPGDRIEAEVVERRRDWLRARITAVRHPGPARVVPGCRWFPACGGCQWQHVAPPAQRHAKAAVVAEQLARGAALRDVPVLPILAGDAWGYRARVTLAVQGRRAGYQRARSHALVETTECPIAAPVVSAHLGVARAWVASLRVPLVRVTIAAAGDGVVLVGTATARPGPPDEAATASLLRDTPSVRGAVVVGPGGDAALELGDPTVTVPIEPGLALEAPADVFTQVHPAANPLLVSAVLALGAFRAGERVLDLYAGAGNFALPLARREVRVHGIEAAPRAIAAARANAERLGLASATFERATVAAALPGVAPGTVDAVVLDPPRAGAADAIAALAALRPARIVYVSCDPATLARDVRRLVARGYGLERVQPVDIFPQTYHVESVAELRLT
jgi:23S rRNA (uracil1939-C5)-methyltransferase